MRFFADDCGASGSALGGCHKPRSFELRRNSRDLENGPETTLTLGATYQMGQVSIYCGVIHTTVGRDAREIIDERISDSSVTF